MDWQESCVNQIIVGDALKLLDTLPDNSVNLILTDIPYGVVNRVSNGLRYFDKEDADIVDCDLSELVNKLVHICSGSIYAFVA